MGGYWAREVGSQDLLEEHFTLFQELSGMLIPSERERKMIVHSLYLGPLLLIGQVIFLLKSLPRQGTGQLSQVVHLATEATTRHLPHCTHCTVSCADVCYRVSTTYDACCPTASAYHHTCVGVMDMRLWSIEESRLRAAEGDGSSRGREASSSMVSSFHCCSCRECGKY